LLVAKFLALSTNGPPRSTENDWWYRKGGEEYIPPLEKGNESLKGVLAGVGLEIACNESDGVKEGTMEVRMDKK
jgi:hypothetical protein